MEEQFKKWITAHKRELVFYAALVFVVSISFSAGYVINMELYHAPIIIEKCSS